MKKSVMIRMVSLTVAFVLLVGAITVSAFTGSPYETLKKAALDAVTFRNATLEMEASIKIDGVEQSVERMRYINGDNSFLSYRFDDESNVSGFEYSGEGLGIRHGYTAEDGTQWYYAEVLDPNYYGYDYGYGLWRNRFMILTPEDRNSSRLRFLELAVDAMVGDLKNNITMSTHNGVRYVRGTLTESQIPELVKAGIEMMVENSNQYYHCQRDVSFDGRMYVYEYISISNGMKTATTWRQPVRPMTDEEVRAWCDGSYYNEGSDNFWGVTYLDDKLYVNTSQPEYVNEYRAPATSDDYSYDGSSKWDIPIKSLSIQYVNGEAEIDGSGNIMRFGGEGVASVTNVLGESFSVEIDVSVRFTDIGTSNPDCPIPGAELLLTPSYMKANFGIENMGVYFTVNADGSIDAASVTTAYPGQYYMNNEPLFNYNVEDENGVNVMMIRPDIISSDGIILPPSPPCQLLR